MEEQKEEIKTEEEVEVVSIQKWGPPRNKIKVQLPGQNNAAEIYTHDEYGLAIDPKFWARSACTDCYGRGQTWKRGKRIIKAARWSEDKKTLLEPEKSEPHEEMIPCHCAMRRYNRTREMVQDRLHRAQTSGKSETRELERIHAENGHYCKFTRGPILEATPSDEEAVAKIEDTAPQVDNTAT